MRRADEVELGDRPWVRAPRQIAHPGLAAQLGDVLARAGDRVPDDWRALARVRLAVRLAREARTSELAPALLDLAANDSWGAYMRLLAAATAYETTPASAVPHLTRILAGLTDVEYASRVDPDDELRGALLHRLWPSHISTTQVLPHVRARRNHHLFGSCQQFLRTFAARLPEADVPAVLSWARMQIDQRAPGPAVRGLTDEAQAPNTGPPDERPVGPGGHRVDRGDR